MPSKPPGRDDWLRQRAQARLPDPQRAESGGPPSIHETQRLLHELQVHQIELELQNDELQSSRTELEVALARYTELYDFAPVGFFTLARDGAIAQTNRAGAQLLGLDGAASTVQRLGDFVAESDRRRLDDLLQRVFSGVPQPAEELELTRAKQPPRTVQIETTLSSDGHSCRASVADITDRKLLEQARIRADELEVERQAAYASSHAKSAFMSRMSHELRTPLNAILGFAQLLKMDREHPLAAPQIPRLEAILHSGWHLLHLIEDVLDLSGIDADTMRMNIAPVVARRVLDESLQLLNSALSNSGLTVDFEFRPDAAARRAVVQADSTRLTQVMVNLLSNAIKYNSVGGTVRITVDTTQPDMTRIAVADTGRGMDAAQRAHLFEPFNRLGQERSGIPGTGIGLVITKRLVETMGGKLTAYSEPGTGSRFVVSLPSARTESESESEAEADSEVDARADGLEDDPPRPSP